MSLENTLTTKLCAIPEAIQIDFKGAQLQETFRYLPVFSLTAKRRQIPLWYCTQQASTKTLTLLYIPQTQMFSFLLSTIYQPFKILQHSTQENKDKIDIYIHIAVQDTYLHLGQKRSAAIIGVHAFTGCDVTVRFGGITKDWCFKVFLTCDDRILDALGHLGKEVLEPDTWAQLERFVCPIFKSKLHRAVKDLRWFFFSNRAAEGENLPPTFGALYLHILWANLV